MAAGVAHRGAVHAGDLPELALGAPEAAEPEDRCLHAVGEGRLERRAEHEVRVGHGELAGVAPLQRVGGLGHLGLVAEEELMSPSRVTSVGHGPCYRAGAAGARRSRSRSEGRAFPRGHHRAARGELARPRSDRILRARARGRGVLPAHQERDLPGDADRGDVRGRGGPAARADAAQHPARERRAARPPAEPGQPRLHAARRRSLAAGHARLPRAALGAARRGASCEIRCHVRQVPVRRLLLLL